MTESSVDGRSIRLTKIAGQDLAGAIAAIDDPGGRARFAARLRGVLGQVLRFLLSGRLVPERRSSGCREVMVPPYRIVYAIVGAEVQVVRVWHGRRDLRAPDLAIELAAEVDVAELK